MIQLHKEPTVSSVQAVQHNYEAVTAAWAQATDCVADCQHLQDLHAHCHANESGSIRPYSCGVSELYSRMPNYDDRARGLRWTTWFDTSSLSAWKSTHYRTVILCPAIPSPQFTGVPKALDTHTAITVRPERVQSDTGTGVRRRRMPSCSDVLRSDV